MSNFYTIEPSYIEHLKELGLDVELICKKSNIPLKGIKGNYNLTKKQYLSMMDYLDMYAKDEHIIKMGDINGVMMFIPPLFAAMCSKDGQGCYKRIAMHKKLIGPFKLDIETTDERLSLSIHYEDTTLEIPRFMLLTEQVLMVSIIRKATGLHICPTKVTSPYDYGDGKLEEFFGIKPYQSKNNTVEFSIKDMQEPFLTQNNIMWEYLEPELTKRMKELEYDETYAARVRSVLFELIPAGEDHIDTVAKELALSVRSLQRRLAEENTTYLKQLNHTRELLARHYLKDKKITNDDIAYLIGYSDANAFQRAFRNWTGITVGEYRKTFNKQPKRV